MILVNNWVMMALNWADSEMFSPRVRSAQSRVEALLACPSADFTISTLKNFGLAKSIQYEPFLLMIPTRELILVRVWGIGCAIASGTIRGFITVASTAFTSLDRVSIWVEYQIFFCIPVIVKVDRLSCFKSRPLSTIGSTSCLNFSLVQTAYPFSHSF